MRSRVRLEDGPDGPRFVADDADPLDAETVRAVLEPIRR
jgi:hypothetical protein